MVKNVTVVMPAFNARRYVAEALESVAAQTYPVSEILVVDDGSTDGTGELARSVDSRVRVIRQVNQGVSAARNTGLDQSKGDYVALLDADDVWLEGKIEQQIKYLEAHPEKDLCYVATVVVNEQLEEIGRITAAQYDDYCEALLLHSCVVTGSCSSVMLRRSVVDSGTRFDLRFSTCADWDFWIRLSRRCSFGAINEPLVLYRELGGSMSSNPALVERDTIGVVTKFFTDPSNSDRSDLRRRTFSRQYMMLAGMYYQAGRQRDFVRCAARSLAAHPASIDRLITYPLRAMMRRRNAVMGAQIAHRG